MKTVQRLRGIVGVLLSLAAAIVPPTQAAIIGADGGITLYISYDNLDVVGGASWNDMITQVNSMTGASCSPTNSARTLFGAPSSLGSCPGGDTCLGHEKLTGAQWPDGEDAYERDLDISH